MTSVGPYARDRAGASRPGCHRQRRCRTSAVSPVRGAREEPGRTTRRSSATSRGRPCANRLRERVARPCRERQNQDAYLEYSVGLAQLLNLGGRFEVRRWLQQL